MQALPENPSMTNLSGSQLNTFLILDWLRRAELEKFF
jgi:hypothetical protein